MVGDGMHDMQSGNAAGAVTCLIKHDWNLDARDQADFLVDNLGEITGILENDCD
jgi:phosphoglycolate phosphatase-like HAD superfamily hydrolase